MLKLFYEQLEVANLIFDTLKLEDISIDDVYP
jgi:hypothetical protein